METIIKPSASIRQNYNEISALCKEKQTPVFLTKNGEGDLVVMDIQTYDAMKRRLELFERLLKIEENRLSGSKDQSAREILKELRGTYE